MRIPLINSAFALGMALLSSSAISAQEIAPSLPGGASSLTEQHGDWTVNCAMSENGAQCNLSQSLVAEQTGQHVLSMELTPVDQGAGLTGVLVMPFNLHLARGVTLIIDENAPSDPNGFFTCLEVGCLVPISFNTAELVALRAGTSLVIGATTTSGQPLSLAISLAGISAAANRTIELMR